MKKGFTLVELMAALVIISILLLIAVPVYNGVRENVNKSIYESKIAEVKSKAMGYASETNRTVMDVKTLISEGLITADNEAGEYNDPRDGRSMLCDIINVIYKNNQYEASITESETCYEMEELENLFGMIQLKVYKDEGLTEEIKPVEETEWYTEPVVYVSYELKSEYQEYEEYIEEISWIGEEPKNCSKESNNIGECKAYNPIETSEIKNVGIRVQINFNVNGSTFITSVSKNILVDRQKPLVLDGSVQVENETSTSSERRVNFSITDNAGSGIKNYAIVSEKTCNGSEYEEKKKQSSDGIQTEYVGNGTYYICVEDKVGNKTTDEDLNNPAYQITVSNVDSSKPVIESIDVTTSANGYNNLTPTIKIKAQDDGGVENLTMCISTSGYMEGCTWEKYNETKSNYNVGGSLDGQTRTIYVSIQDNAGNIATRSKTYTVYKECSQQTKVYTDSNYGSCSKKCGGGVQYRNYKMVDKYNSGKTCSTNRDSKSCNTMSCCSSKKVQSTGAWSACSKSCGGGTQTRTVTYVSSYDSSVSCGSTTQSQTCNTQSCDPVEGMDPNNYESSKNVACNATYFQRLVDNYISKFQSALQYQNFRNAMYDCASTTESILRKSNAAWNALKNSGRTAISSGRGRSASGKCKCTYYYSSGNERCSGCSSAAITNSASSYASDYLYSGKVLIMSMTQNRKIGTSKDFDGYGEYDEIRGSTEYWGWTDLYAGGANDYGSVGSWGFCTFGTDGIYNSGYDSYGYGCTERGARISEFKSGLRVGFSRSESTSTYTSSHDGWSDAIYYYSDQITVLYFKI